MSSRGRKGTVSIALIVMGFGILLIALMLTAAAHRVWEASLRVKEAAREPSAGLAIFLYNEKLCDLLNGRRTTQNWRVVVMNVGGKIVTLDHVAFERSGAKVGWREPNKELLPGEYWSMQVEGSVCSGSDCSALVVHAHAGGIYVSGGRSTPNPYVLTRVIGNACQEP
ncbi:MAG: hypothetical protein QXP81_08490 [Nitrososphaerota archaeon]